MEDKIVTIEELLIHLSPLKAYNACIIFTNGCFDILHVGHVDYLSRCKNFGDTLIVGLNSDNSVKQLKGNSRPINNEHHRAFMLAHLEMVDYVVIFNEETPYELIKAIKPDILVKGNDYKPDQVVGYDIAKQTVLIPFKYDISTTQIINKLRG